MATTTYVSSGDLLNYTPAAAVSAGEIVFKGTRACQVVADLAADQLGAVRHEGVVRVTKASASVFADGSVVNWNATTKLADAAGADGTVGIAVGGGADGETYVDVLLNAKKSGEARLLRTRATIAQINAGLTLLPAIPGSKYRMHDVSLIAIGGAAATATTVDILGTQSASSVKLLAAAVAGLTQNTVLRAGATNAAVLAGGLSFVANDANTAITLGKTGSDVATATHVDVLLTYSVE